MLSNSEVKRFAVALVISSLFVNLMFAPIFTLLRNDFGIEHSASPIGASYLSLANTNSHSSAENLLQDFSQYAVRMVTNRSFSSESFQQIIDRQLDHYFYVYILYADISCVFYYLARIVYPIHYFL